MSKSDKELAVEIVASYLSGRVNEDVKGENNPYFTTETLTGILNVALKAVQSLPNE